MNARVIETGTTVRFDARSWTVAALEGARARLVAEEDGAVAVVLLPHLFTDPDFEVVGGTPRGKVPPFGLLDSLPDTVRTQAVAWERHVREVETGLADPHQPGGPRPEFDPAMTSMAEREAAKAAELTAAGQRTSVPTVRRMRARYREQGVWGLVDHRATRPRSPLGRADPRVVAAIVEALEAQRDRSTGTLTRLRTQVAWILEDRYKTDPVPVPPAATFNRLVHALADGQGLLGSATQRRNHASRPAAPFAPTVALRPGELVMLDSTPLDVAVVLDDGVTGRVELTIALDVATRSICAAVLRPMGTKSVDAAVLLAEMAAPMRMRPGWDRELAMERSVIPYERLLPLDERLAGAAARPVIVPEMVVVDQGRVFVSPSFLAACASLGVSVQPVPPANGPAKGHVERTFRTINHRFSQYVAGYTGSSIAERGSAAWGEACWSLPQIKELFDEWLVTGWQQHRHQALRHPLMPKLALSPNEMWSALVGVTGYVPVPLSRDDYIELMPVRRQAINDYGIRFGYRTYDDAVLNGFRRRRSTDLVHNGRWEVHYNPYDPTRIWVRLPDGFVEVPWIHRTQVSMPFTDFTWNHVRRSVTRRAGREEHEAVIARALDDLLRRAGQGQGSRRERTVAARAAAAASLTGPPAPSSESDPAPTGALSASDTFTLLQNLGGQQVEEHWDEEDDMLDDHGLDRVAGTDSAASPETLPRARRIYNPYQEAELW